MVDIGVGGAEIPKMRIGREGLFHILMHVLLEIETDLAKRADHDIRADALVHRHIASRISEGGIGRVIRRE